MAFSNRSLGTLSRLHREGKKEAFKELLLKEAMKKFKDHLSWIKRRRENLAAYKRQERAAELREQRERKEKMKALRQIEELQKLNEKRRLEAERQEHLLLLIKEKKVTVTAKLMKSIKDPVYKKTVIEAICLSKV